MPLPAFLAWVAPIFTGVIIRELMNPKPTDNITVYLPENKPKDPKTERPTLPPVSNPPTVTRPTPKAPPAPRNPYDDPLPSPVGTPFPKLPPRTLPDNVDLDQTQQRVTSQVKETLANRRYGCLLYSPIFNGTFSVNGCDFTNEINTMKTDQLDAIKRFFSWVIRDGNQTVTELRQSPDLSALLDLVGLGADDTAIEDFLIDKSCDLALIGFNFVTRGITGVKGSTAFLYGCEILAKLALMYTEANRESLGSFPIIVNAYTDVQFVTCPGGVQLPTPDNQLPDDLVLGNDGCWEPDTVLLPDTAAFTNKGHYLVLYWVLASNPSYQAYYTTWQIPSPIDDLVNVLDDQGNLKLSLCEANWENYFAGIHRTQGYQSSRIYVEERKQPLAKGHFTSKEDATKCLNDVAALSSLTVRDRAPIVHSTATEDEYLKSLSHVGEKMILRKVNVIKKLPNEDNATLLVSYKGLSPSQE